MKNEWPKQVNKPKLNQIPKKMEVEALNCFYGGRSCDFRPIEYGEFSKNRHKTLMLHRGESNFVVIETLDPACNRMLIFRHYLIKELNARLPSKIRIFLISRNDAQSK